MENILAESCNKVSAFIDDLKTAVDSNDILAIGKLIYFYSEVFHLSSLVQEKIVSDGARDYVAEARECLAQWKSKLKENDVIDTFSAKYNVWYETKILNRNGNILSVHYNSWSSKFDEDIDMRTTKIYPKNSITVPRKKGSRRGSKPKYFVEVIDDDESNLNDSMEKNASDENNIIEMASDTKLSVDNINSNEPNLAISKYGRKIIPIVSTSNNSNNNKKKIHANNTLNLLNNDNNNNIKVGDNEENVSNKNDSSLYLNRECGTDFNEWFCSICFNLDALDNSDLILCDGPCKKSFHLGCLNMTVSEVRLFSFPKKKYHFSCVWSNLIYLFMDSYRKVIGFVLNVEVVYTRALYATMQIR